MLSVKITARFFGTVVFFLIVFFGLTIPAVAAGFNYSHIKIWDFGRGLDYIPSAAIRNQAYDFFAVHTDVAEAGEVSGITELHSRNANLKVFRYDLDVTACRHVGCSKNNALVADPAGVEESYYLHFSEDTQLTVSYVDGTTETFVIPGCPDKPTAACRVRTGMWLDSRWVYNPKDTGFRTWMGNLLLTNAAGYDGVFLDEHGPGTGQNWPSGATGGGIWEYGGRKLDEIIADYNADLVAALAVYKQIFSAQGKFLTINGASWSFSEQMIIDQAKAAGGVVTELAHRPNAFDGAVWYEAAIKNVDRMVAAGALIDLYDSPCRDLDSIGMTAGNYSSAFARWQMWRLASYYMMREMPDGSTGPGAVYFDPNFCMKPYTSGHELDFIDEWLAAYEKNVGAPDGPRSATFYASGVSPQAASCTGEPSAPNYGVLYRSYDNGNVLILVRPNDRWDCAVYGDASAVTLNLPDPMQLLLDNGTLAAATTTIKLRSGEAAILFKSAETPPPVLDTTLPTISSVASTTAATSAVISWTTNEAANSIVQYGLSVDYGFVVSSTFYTTTHTISLSNLTADTTYYFRVISCDSANNSATSSSYTFRTTAVTAPVTYTIGGTITGLSGTVILRNNGGDTLTRSVTGSFVFPTALTNGESYSVSIYSQPSGQSCSVSNGTGTITSNVANITITCVDNVTNSSITTPSTSAAPTSTTNVRREVPANVLAQIHATCPIINAGDLVKVIGKPAIYYVNAQYEVLYFPSSNEFKSWNRDESFSGYYKKISQACFDNLLTPLNYPAAVNFRPGTLVKRETSAQLYTVVAGNTLRKISVADAKAIYGAKYVAWNILDVFWPHYTAVTDGVSGQAPPNILVRRNNKVYYLDNDRTIREISTAAIVANRFKDANIRVVPDSYLAGYTTGVMISSAVSSIIDRAQILNK